MKKKVFVITEDYINDFCGDNVINIVGVFTEKEKAVAKLHELAESYKKEERTLWDGSYSQEHYTIILHESTLTD